MLSKFKESATASWSKTELGTVEVEYRSRLSANQIKVLHDIYIEYNPV